jgi:hypothetical protein
MTPDLINGLFEFCGALMLAKNVHQLYKDELVRGVHWMPTMFFAAWGLWNVYFYPAYDLMWSFAGGIAIVSVNLVWFGLMVYYKERERRGYIWDHYDFDITEPKRWWKSEVLNHY